MEAWGHALSAGTTPRTRWNGARALCRPQSFLSLLSLAYLLSRTRHLHQKTSPCQRCPASPASACGRRADAHGPCCSFPSSSSHLVGGLVTHAASPSLDPLAAQSPGHRASSTQFTTCLHACCFLARRASALAYDVATTARTQYATKERPACQDYRVWALIRLCPDARFASRLSYCVLLTKLILDLDSPVERIRLLIFALCFR